MVNQGVSPQFCSAPVSLKRNLCTGNQTTPSISQWSATADSLGMGLSPAASSLMGNTDPSRTSSKVSFTPQLPSAFCLGTLDEVQRFFRQCPIKLPKVFSKRVFACLKILFELIRSDRVGEKAKYVHFWK